MHGGHVGLLLFANDHYLESAPWLARAQSLDPNDVRWPYLWALAIKRTDPEAACDALQRALQLRPADVTIRLRLGEVLLAANRWEEAEETFAAVLSVDAQHPRALLGRGRMLLRRGEAQAALGPLKQAALHPTARQAARTSLAEAYMRLGDPAAANRELQISSACDEDVPWPDPRLAEVERHQAGLQPRLRRVRAAIGGSPSRESVAAARRCASDYPASAEAQLLLGHALLRVNDLAGASRALTQATRLDPNLADGYHLLGALHLSRHDLAGAETQLQKALKTRPSHSMAMYHLGLCRKQAGNEPGAVEAWSAAIATRPGFVLARMELGESLVRQGRMDDAIAILQPALDLDPKNTKALALLEQARAAKK